jgi:hypothetical protein
VLSLRLVLRTDAVLAMLLLLLLLLLLHFFGVDSALRCD